MSLAQQHLPVLDAAHRGDPAALAQLLRLCQPDIRRYAQRNCLIGDVDDAVQEALLVLSRKLSSVRMLAAFSGWLFKNSPSLNVVEHPVYDVWVKDCAMKFPGEEEDASAAASSAAKPSGKPSAAASPRPAAKPTRFGKCKPASSIGSSMRALP